MAATTAAFGAQDEGRQAAGTQAGKEEPLGCDGSHDGGVWGPGRGAPGGGHAGGQGGTPWMRWQPRRRRLGPRTRGARRRARRRARRNPLAAMAATTAAFGAQDEGRQAAGTQAGKEEPLGCDG